MAKKIDIDLIKHYENKLKHINLELLMSPIEAEVVRLVAGIYFQEGPEEAIAAEHLFCQELSNRGMSASDVSWHLSQAFETLKAMEAFYRWRGWRPLREINPQLAQKLKLREYLKD